MVPETYNVRMEPFEPREPKGSAGPTSAIIIILLLMIAGAIYFWYAKERRVDTLPYIPGNTSTTTSQ